MYDLCRPWSGQSRLKEEVNPSKETESVLKGQRGKGEKRQESPEPTIHQGSQER